MFGGTDLTQLYYNSTLPLDGDTGEIVWPYQHLNDHWDLAVKACQPQDIAVRNSGILLVG